MLNARIQRDCCKTLMSKEIWRNCVKAFWEWEQYLGNAKKRDDKGEMTAPCRPGPSVMENKQQGQRKAVCLVTILWEALNQQWLPGRVRQGSNHYRLPRSHQRKMEKESLEEWAWSPMWCGFHRDQSLHGSQEGQFLSSEQLTSY